MYTIELLSNTNKQTPLFLAQRNTSLLLCYAVLAASQLLKDCLYGITQDARSFSVEEPPVAKVTKEKESRAYTAQDYQKKPLPPSIITTKPEPCHFTGLAPNAPSDYGAVHPLL